MIYQFKKGARIGSGVDPQKAGEKIEEIRERDGGIQTEAILAEAKKKRSPLHSAFEWDDTVASHQYRLIQARQLVKALVVCLEEGDEPAYVHIKVDSAGYYQSTEVACRNTDEWSLAHASAISRLQSASVALDQLDRVADRVRRESAGTVKDVRDTVSRAAQQLANA
jgi:hypothetical protein